ncbi:G2/mitotic-specific cyclin-A [Octopus bimaculoides]|uniref:Uncharacterized protein n=1 Tax=Octopus bimaculoides TaxID=37653 RepID=A0A0L8G370_OCTBM|nr:G2/mitotic-specific cyclin-A [Octopus bimaculoides]|eukprot:XP_014784653.1 PREDICTED: G2/mitotic-specific cyclin-A-like [Octopus bimaculoides]
MSLQNNGTNRQLAQPARILKENTLINDENRVPTENDAVSRFGRNQKKREVLGELGRAVGSDLNVYLDKNVPVTQQRKRPLRNAKLGSVSGQDENDFQQKYKVTDYDHIPRKSGFKIHVDNEENSESAGDMSFSKEDLAVEGKLEMHAAVTALPKQPFDRLEQSYGMDLESPMVLDTSLDQSSICDTKEVVHSLSPYDTYKNDIFQYIRESEEKNRPRPTYMNKQTDITHSMRSILVDWLVEVTEEYKLLSDTLFLAVNYIDRFLSVMAVNRGKLQLLGTACMFIASKFEEIEAPDLGEFVYITDDTYTRNQVLKMEQLILKVLSFTVAVPTATTFLDHYFHEATLDKKQFQYLARFLLELTLLDADPYLQYKPSIIAAAAFFLAAKTLGCEVSWVGELEQLTGYSVSDFQSCVKLLYVTHKSASKHAQQAIYLKYSSDKFLKVATIPPLQIKNFKVS